MDCRIGVLSLLVFLTVSSARGEDAKAGKPLVVVLGDSIRLGYAPTVVEKLKGLAEVVSPAENGGDSANILKHLDEWVIIRNPAVVHFNAGLHDLRTDSKTGEKQVGLEAYRANLAKIIERLEKETSARLIFATTTPVIDERVAARKGVLRFEADVEAYNAAAREVLGKSAVLEVDDLHGLTLTMGVAEALTEDGVHFTAKGSKGLGEQVAKSISRALEEPVVDKKVVCRWAASAPTIDGKLDEHVWKSAVVIERFPAFWSNKESGKGMRARLLWDKDALYFAGTMTDSEIKSIGTKRNDRLWEGDVFELFFKPFDDRPEYYEFQVNPKSVILELPFAMRGEDFDKVAALPASGYKAVARVDGTVDRPSDVDRGWSVEGRIPWEAFAKTGGRPEAGASWKFAICRFDYGPEGTKSVEMSSAPLRRFSFHRYEDYGVLRFAGPER